MARTMGRDATAVSAPVVAFVAARFRIPELAVREVATLPLEALRERDRYLPPSGSLSPALDAPRYPLGSAQAMLHSDDPYLQFLAEVDPNQVHPNEAEENIRLSTAFKAYVHWAREGIEPPYITVFEVDSGKLVTPNRRRTLAAREAGRSMHAWLGRVNRETGLPLKHRDVVQAIEEAKMVLQASSSAAGVRGGRAVEHDPLTCAYVAIGAKEALAGYLQGRVARMPGEMSEQDYIEAVIEHAPMLDGMFERDYPDGLSGVFVYEVAEPFGTAYGNWFLTEGYAQDAAARGAKAAEMAMALFVPNDQASAVDAPSDAAREPVQAPPRHADGRGLWKTTIVVWSEESAGDPMHREASELVRDGESGESYIEFQSSELFLDPAQWPDTDFFGPRSQDDDEDDGSDDEDGSDAMPAPGM